MADIFVSYKREDREAVRRLVEALQAKGWSVWWDTRIGAGESWDRVIERELEAAGCVVVVWSKASVESDWVRQEAREGRERGCLVPVTIDGTRPPLEFRSVQAVDLAHWRGDTNDPAFLEVCAGVGRVLGTASVPTAGTAAAGQATAAEWIRRGDAHFKNKDYDRAIADYTRAIENDPRSALAYRNRGSVYFQNGDFDRAIADDSKAIDIDPRYAFAYRIRGHAYKQKGDFDRAIADYTEAINIEPRDAVTYISRAWSFEARLDAGDRDRAIADFRQALDIVPDLGSAKEGLKRLGVIP